MRFKTILIAQKKGFNLGAMLGGATSLSLELDEQAAVISNEVQLLLKKQYVFHLLTSARVWKIGFNGFF